MRKKIAVVIVTYNRLELLKECLDCVKAQRLEPSKIIIVNNHSTDGTGEFLSTISEKNDPRWIIYTEEDNIGGAGGFHDGIKLAMQTEMEWILLIDDDAMLAEDYLERIFDSMSRHSDVMAYSGSVVTDGNYALLHRRRLDKKEIPVSVDEYNNEEFEYDLSSFCGLVINRMIVDKIGYPEKDFFIWYDDTEYSIRIRKISKIINVNGAILNHKTKIENSDNVYHRLNWKSYYGYRNTVYTYRKHGMYYKLFRYLIRKWLMVAYYILLNKHFDRGIARYNIRLIWKGIYDGFRGNLGMDKKYKP